MANRLEAVVLDIDNTLFDWLGMWHAAFRGMLDVLTDASGVPEERLLDQFRAVHQRHGTVEYAFSIAELPSLQELHPRETLADVFGNAIHRYRVERRKRLVPYPGVVQTLEALKKAGVKLAAYTESLSFYAQHRIRRLRLDGLIASVYSPPDHAIPDWIDLKQVRHYPQAHYRLARTKHRLLPAGTHKPDADVLKSILGDLGVSPDEAMYVGDSITHDVLMAKRAHVLDVWAAYGSVPSRKEYDLLRRVTHWTDAQVAQEKTLRSVDVKPTLTLRSQFSELLAIDAVEFGPRIGRRLRSQGR